ncbi:MAG TPA: amidohydrolase family protein [Actinopolymorphaceae bacterium]
MTVEGPGAAARTAMFERRPLDGIPVVDAHAHGGPYSRFFIPDNGTAGMMRVMERVGVDVALVSSHLALELDVEGGNAETAAMVEESGGRLRGLIVANPHIDPERTLATWLDDERFVGVKLHPELHEYPVTGSRYEPVWAAAAARGFPVLVHSWAGSEYNDIPMFGTVAERHPDATILLGHSGARRSFLPDVAGLACRHPNLILETCGSYMTGSWLRYFVEQVGAEQVVFGSDFPFIDLRYAIGRALFAELPDDDLALVLGGTISRLVRRVRPDDPAFAELATGSAAIRS